MHDIYFSKGNKKLKSTKALKFLIWNLPAVKTCPFATESCKRLCYARKAERVYPSVLPCREKNFQASKSPDFVEKVIEIIKKEKDNRVLVVRIHESGDFYNKEYAEKWLAMMWCSWHIRKVLNILMA